MSNEAKLKYLDSEFLIIQNGSFVLCAVSGEKIPLADLRYWSVDLQEAYADANRALARFQENEK